MSKGVLYVVATPIGNLDDMTYRAVKVLKQVDLIAAEDTRHARRLLTHYGIATPMLSLHEHNEKARAPVLLERLNAGESVALISDAGTPLISDPGYPLVNQARREGINVVPVPGANAAVCALSAAGLPTDRFLFVGFPPKQASRRLQWLKSLANHRATLVFYESSHRILNSLQAMVETFGGSRAAVLARELTKLHETFLSGNLQELIEKVGQDTNQQRGEFVVLVSGYGLEENESQRFDTDLLLKVLGEELPVKQAARLAAVLTGGKKNELYQRLLSISEASE